MRVCHTASHPIQALVFRSKVVSAVQFSSMLVNWILLAGMVLLAVTKNPTILLIGIIIMSVTVLFTLPVEFDASKRALAWLNNTNVTNAQEYSKAKDALKMGSHHLCSGGIGSGDAIDTLI